MSEPIKTPPPLSSLPQIDWSKPVPPLPAAPALSSFPGAQWDVPTSEKQPMNGWLAFLDHYPSISVTSDFSIEEGSVDLDDGKKRDVTVIKSGLGVSAVFSPSKDQDTLRMDQVGDVVCVAIGDGVSNGAVPEVASRCAVEAATKQVKQSGIVDHNVVVAANEAIQTADVPSLADTRLKYYKSKSTGEIGDAWESMAYNLEGYITTGKMAATQLLAAKYDSATGLLDFIVRGDAAVTIIKRNGEVEKLKGTEAEELIYDPRRTVTENGDITGSIILDSGDVALLETDGSTKIEQFLESICAYIAEHRGEGEINNGIVKLVENMLKCNPDDDVTTLVISKK